MLRGGERWFRRLARSAVAAGADGLIVEVHPHPDEAWSDGEQSLTFAEFDAMMADLAMWCELRGARSCRAGDGGMSRGAAAAIAVGGVTLLALVCGFEQARPAPRYSKTN